MDFNGLWDKILLGFNDFLVNIDPFVVIQKVFSVIIIIIIMKIAMAIRNRVIDSLINSNNKLTKITKKNTNPVQAELDEKRYNTLNVVSKSVTKYAILFVGTLLILGNFINVGSLLTLAGVGGIAIAFGAQSLVEDVVTGFFILLEDQFAVGEYVTIGGTGGIVEEIGLRTTKIRGFTGDLHILHNRNISEITNHARGNMRAMIDVCIAYEEDIQKCIDVLRRLCLKVGEEFDQIVEGPDVLGVEKLDESSVNIRIIAKTVPMEQWGVERVLRQRIKEEFDRENIEIPYAKLVVHRE